MKEFDVALKAVAEGLRTMAQGMEKIAEKIEESTPKKQAKAKPVRKAKKAPAKKTPAKKTARTGIASDAVLAVINRSKKGVNSATLAKKTGFDNKKIANIVFKLKKQGKVKSFIRGVYTKA